MSVVATLMVADMEAEASEEVETASCKLAGVGTDRGQSEGEMVGFRGEVSTL